MKKDTKDRLFLTAAGLGVGLFLILEGLGVMSVGNRVGNTPEWVLIAMGCGFTIAGIMVLMNKPGKWNDLLASIITAIMAAIFGWISIFSDSAGASGNVMFISALTGIPFHRIVFGLGATCCLTVSGYAFAMFWRKLLNKKLRVTD